MTHEKLREGGILAERIKKLSMLISLLGYDYIGGQLRVMDSDLYWADNDLREIAENHSEELENDLKQYLKKLEKDFEKL